MKKEVLKAIANISVRTTDFHHNLIHNSYSIATNVYEVESDNYLIILRLMEQISCDNYGNISNVSLDVEYFEVCDEDTTYITDSITNEEIINQLNY